MSHRSVPHYVYTKSLPKLFAMLNRAGWTVDDNRAVPAYDDHCCHSAELLS
jgi:hypothetical protein